MGKLVADLVDKHNTILMANHGVVTWSHNSIEDAYWRMEIIEAYCRTVVVAVATGQAAARLSPGPAAGPAQDQAEPGLRRSALRPEGMRAVRQRRMAARECSARCLRSNGGDASRGRHADPEAERMVQMVTDMIMERIKQDAP